MRNGEGLLPVRLLVLLTWALRSGVELLPRPGERRPRKLDRPLPPAPAFSVSAEEEMRILLGEMDLRPFLSGDLFYQIMKMTQEISDFKHNSKQNNAR